MPRYFFDIYDGQKTFIDDEGQELESVEQVRKEAQSLLPEIAYNEIPRDGDHKFYVVMVRDEHRRQIFSATLNYHGLWLGSAKNSSPSSFVNDEQ